jgi:riboflavin synthase
MFTGIVQAIGQIESVLPQSTVYRGESIQPATSAQGQTAWTDQQGLRLLLTWGDLDGGDVREGDSIALNGACMTVLRPDEHGFAVDISRESLNRTVGLSEPGPVNLEKAMRASDRLGGHMVSGHVDTTASIFGLDRIDESVRLQIALPASLSAFVTEKGSIAVHGVSLTVNSLVDGRGPEGQTVISINLIPHTWQSTTLSHKKVGDLVNIEVDPMARQVARILERLHGVEERRA